MENLEVRLQKRMHVSLYALLFLTVLLGISILLEGCSDTCETKVHYTYFEPVYAQLDELRGSVGVMEPQPLTVVGKIYRKGNFLFINEPGKGIHVVDNANPAAPVIKNFLNIPGNFDLAVKDNSLYTDSYIDLLVFDITDIANIKQVKRLENVFTNYNNLAGFTVDPGRGLITTWEQKEAMDVAVSDCSNSQTDAVIYLSEGIAVMDAGSFYSAINKSSAIAPGNGSGPGVGGSMARFSIAGNYLYALDAGNIQPFDIASVNSPEAKTKTYINWDIETIFPYNENLFIGSSSGMHIVDISEPSSPQLVSTYSHITSCDPVIVDGNFAYVTLRSGSLCAGFTDQLEVINIEDLHNPTLVKVYPMSNPHGLGKDESTLFICDGSAGLKVFNAADVNTITDNLLAHYANIDAYDVIPLNDVLVMIGKDGLFQYDYANPKDIKLLSHIPVHAN